jgi:hypothetical protein
MGCRDQLGQVPAGRVMKFTSAKEITANAATIKAYVREAIAVENRKGDARHIRRQRIAGETLTSIDVHRPAFGEDQQATGDRRRRDLTQAYMEHHGACWVGVALDLTASFMIFICLTCQAI